MNPSLQSTSVSLPARSASVLGVLLIIEALLAFAPVLVLGAAIGWPASLRKPAAEQLMAIAAQADAVAFGYSLYLLYSILIAPVMVGLAAYTLGGLQRPLAATVAGFAVASTLARAIGILRWLTVMPALAQLHRGADPSLQAQVSLVFEALNKWGGGIGEVLGVSLFMAAALGTLALGAWHQRSLPRAFAGTGFLVALMLAATALPSLGLAAVRMPVAVAGTALSVWMLAIGTWLLLRRR